MLRQSPACEFADCHPQMIRVCKWQKKKKKCSAHTVIYTIVWISGSRLARWLCLEGFGERGRGERVYTLSATSLDGRGRSGEKLRIRCNRGNRAALRFAGPRLTTRTFGSYRGRSATTTVTRSWNYRYLGRVRAPQLKVAYFVTRYRAMYPCILACRQTIYLRRP